MISRPNHSLWTPPNETCHRQPPVPHEPRSMTITDYHAKTLESQRNEKRRSLFEAQDKVDQQREDLIANIEGKLQQRASLIALFTIRWCLI